MIKKITLILSTLVLVGGTCFHSRADTLTLVSADWCPFVCESDHPGVLAEHPGFVLDIVKAIFEEKGHQVIYEAPPWTRAISDTRKGKYTGILAALKNDAPDFIYPDEEVGVNRMCFYVKAGNAWRYTGLSSLNSVLLGVIQDYAYDNGVVDAYIKKSRGEKNINVQVSASDRGLEQNFDKMKADRINVILDEHQVIEYYLKVKNLSKNFQQAGCLEEVKMYVGFSPAVQKSKEYAAIFSDGIKELRASGKLQAFLDKYGLKDWKSR